MLTTCWSTLVRPLQRFERSTFYLSVNVGRWEGFILASDQIHAGCGSSLLGLNHLIKWNSRIERSRPVGRSKQAEINNHQKEQGDSTYPRCKGGNLGKTSIHPRALPTSIRSLDGWSAGLASVEILSIYKFTLRSKAHLQKTETNSHMSSRAE